MKPNEVRKLDDEEIAIEIARLRRELFDLRTQAVTEKLQDNSRFAKMKKVVARLLTEQNARAAKTQETASA